MSKRFMVFMRTAGATVPLEQIRTKDASGSVKLFDDEAAALEYATANKDKYETVVAKSPAGNVLVEYHNGSKV